MLSMISNKVRLCILADKLHNGDLAGQDAALTAFDKAKNAGTNENAVIDALEEAELQFEHAKGEAAQGRHLIYQIFQNLWDWGSHEFLKIATLLWQADKTITKRDPSSVDGMMQ